MHENSTSFLRETKNVHRLTFLKLRADSFRMGRKRVRDQEKKLPSAFEAAVEKTQVREARE